MQSCGQAKALRWWRTIGLVLSMFIVGLYSGLVRAIMPDLLVRLNTTAATWSYTLAIGSTGGLFMPIVAFGFDKLVGFEELLTGLFVLCGAFTLVVKPYTLNVWIHTIYNFINQLFFYGPLYLACNSVMSRMWGKDSPRPMQALSLGWPIGAVIGPLIAVPFVSPPDEDTMNSATMSPFTTDVGALDMDVGGPVHYDYEIDAYAREYADGSQIEIACWIGACVIIAVAGVHFALFIVMRGICANDESNDLSVQDNKPSKQTYSVDKQSEHVHKRKLDIPSEAREKAIETPTSQTDSNPKPLTWRDIVTPSKWAAPGQGGKFGFIIATCCTLFYTFLIFSAKGVGGYLTLYAVDSGLGFSNAEAAVMQSTVYIFAIAGYLTAMFAAKHFSANLMIFVELHGQFIMGILMLTVGAQSKVGLWVTASIYTFFLEPSFASGYTWAGLHIILYAFILSAISVITGILNIPVSALQGWLYTYTVIESIFYTTILWAGINCILSYIMIRVTWKRKPIQTLIANVGEPEGEINNSFTGDDLGNGNKTDFVGKLEKQDRQKKIRNGSIEKVPVQYNQKNEMTEL